MVIKYFSLTTALFLSLTLSNSILGSALTNQDTALFRALKEQLSEDAFKEQWGKMKQTLTDISFNASFKALHNGLEAILNKYDTDPTEPLDEELLLALESEMPLSDDSLDLLCTAMRNVANKKHDDELFNAYNNAYLRGAINVDFGHLDYALLCGKGRLDFIEELRMILANLVAHQSIPAHLNLMRYSLVMTINKTNLDVLYNIIPLCVEEA